MPWKNLNKRSMIAHSKVGITYYISSKVFTKSWNQWYCRPLDPVACILKEYWHCRPIKQNGISILVNVNFDNWQVYTHVYLILIGSNFTKTPSWPFIDWWPLEFLRIIACVCEKYVSVTPKHFHTQIFLYSWVSYDFASPTSSKINKSRVIHLIKIPFTSHGQYQILIKTREWFLIVKPNQLKSRNTCI